MADIGEVIYKVRRSLPETAILEEPGNHRMLTSYAGDLEPPLRLLSVGAGEE